MKNFTLLFFLLFLAGSLLTVQSARFVLNSASNRKNILAITESDGDLTWSCKTAGRNKGHADHHDVHMLENGNILFHEIWQDVKEINLKKKAVREFNEFGLVGNGLAC